MKDLLKVYNTPVDFYVTEYEYHWYGFRVHVVTNFKEYHLLSFGVVLKKNNHNDLKLLIKYSSPYQLHIYLRPDFLHVIETRPQIAVLSAEIDIRI